MDYQTASRQYVSVPEAAAYAGISVRSLWRLVERGELRAARFGRSVRVDLHELEQLGRRSTAPDAA